MSESARKKPAKSKIKIPSKKTLNLFIKEKTLASPSRLLPILFIIAAGTYLFSKYAVIARLEKVSQAEAELAEMRSQLEMITDAYADYDEVEAEYRQYSYENFDRTIPDRIDVLEMLQNRLFPHCNIQSLTINGRDVNMVVTGIQIETLTYLNGSLPLEEPLIESVKIANYTDNTGKDSSGKATVTATVSIRLVDATTLAETEQLEFDPDAIIAGGEQTEGEAQPEGDNNAAETQPEGDSQPDGAADSQADGVNGNGGEE